MVTGARQGRRPKPIEFYGLITCSLTFHLAGNDEWWRVSSAVVVPSLQSITIHKQIMRSVELSKSLNDGCVIDASQINWIPNKDDNFSF